MCGRRLTTTWTPGESEPQRSLVTAFPISGLTISTVCFYYAFSFVFRPSLGRANFFRTHLSAELSAHLPTSVRLALSHPLVSVIISLLLPVQLLRDQREKREKDEMEKFRLVNPKITEQFADLKRKLADITDDQWRVTRSPAPSHCASSRVTLRSASSASRPALLLCPASCRTPGTQRNVMNRRQRFSSARIAGRPSQRSVITQSRTRSASSPSCPFRTPFWPRRRPRRRFRRQSTREVRGGGVMTRLLGTPDSATRMHRGRGRGGFVWLSRLPNGISRLEAAEVDSDRHFGLPPRLNGSCCALLPLL